MDSDSDSQLISLITQMISLVKSMDLDTQSELVLLITQIISLVSSLEPGSEVEPEPELMALITQIIHLVSSMDSDSQPEPEPELISLVSQIISRISSLESETETAQFISLCPQVKVKFEQGKFHVMGEVGQDKDSYGYCDDRRMELFSLTKGGDITHFCCPDCNGEKHENYEKAPLEVIHTLHRKHSLQLVVLMNDI